MADISLQSNNQAPSNQGGSGTIVAIISVLLVGVSGYFIYKALSSSSKAKKKREKECADKGGKLIDNVCKTKDGKEIPLSEKPVDDKTPTEDKKTPTWEDVMIKGDFSQLSFPIRKGQRNESVKVLQNLLLQIDPKAISSATGYFGSETERALLKFIQKNKIQSMEDINNLRKIPTLRTAGTQAGIAAATSIGGIFGTPNVSDFLKSVTINK